MKRQLNIQARSKNYVYVLFLMAIVCFNEIMSFFWNFLFFSPRLDRNEFFFSKCHPNMDQ